MPRVTFRVKLGEKEDWKSSRPTGWTVISGFLGLKMVINKVTIIIVTMTKKSRDTAKQILRPLLAMVSGSGYWAGKKIEDMGNSTIIKVWDIFSVWNDINEANICWPKPCDSAGLNLLLVTCEYLNIDIYRFDTGRFWNWIFLDSVLAWNKTKH